MLGPEIAFCTTLLTKVPWGNVGINVHGAAFAGAGMLRSHGAHLSSGHVSSPGNPNWGAELTTTYGLADDPKSGLAQRCSKDSQPFYHCAAGPCNTLCLQRSSIFCLAHQRQPGGSGFLGVSLFSKSSESQAEAAGSVHSKQQ